MKTILLPDGEGTIPLRASKNPVLGVFRHHCGEIASVHQPKGKRSHTRYLICDKCGTDQCGGAEYQSEIKAKTYPTIEALQAADNAVSTVKGDTEVTEQVGEVDAPVLTANVSEEPSLVSDTDIPLETSAGAVSAVNEIAGEVPVSDPCYVSDSASSVNLPPKPIRIGIAAIIGGAIGAVLAAVA